MPRVSEFYGISIYVYYREHMPPHFHAIYGGEEATIGISTLGVLTGHLPPRALGLVMEWASQHQAELAAVWEQAVARQPLGTIAPLK